MVTSSIEQQAVVWLANELPVRMIYAGRRWTVTDAPTRLRESVWAVPVQQHRGLYGWRFQATDAAGESFVFDVYRGEDHWHVHRIYQ